MRLDENFAAFPVAGSVGTKDQFDLIADGTEDIQDILVGAFGVDRIIKPPMITVYLAGKHWTGLIGLSTNRDDRIDLLPEERAEVLGGMARYVDADFLHDFDSFWMHVTSRVGTGAMDFKKIARHLPQNSFGKMTATGVAGTENENGGFGHNFIY